MEQGLVALGTHPHRLTEILPAVPQPTVRGRYLHWENLRHRTPPAGLSLDEWWLGLKFARTSAAKPMPLVGFDGRPFTRSAACFFACA